MGKLQQKLPFLIVILSLLTVGIGSIYYRSVNTGIPFFPGKTVNVWKVEAKIEFNAKNDAVKVKLALPDESAYKILDEQTASPGYGIHILRNETANEVVWSKRKVTGKQTLYYQTTIRAQENVDNHFAASNVNNNIWADPYHEIAKSLIETAFIRSSDQLNFARELYKLVDSQAQEASLLLSKYSSLEVLTYLLRLADIPVREVKGIILENNLRNQKIASFLKIYVNNKLFILNPELGLISGATPLLVWQENTRFLLDVEGGTKSDIRFSVSRTTRSELNQSVSELEDTKISNFSLYKLPIAEQNVFKGILLLPIGTLVVVFLRILIGLKCSGTFMPVLIASSFLQTTLVTGLVGFLSIVAAGLVIRSYLSNLNLLLVSRISAVVILVIGIIVAYTIISYQLGISEGLSIAFFPMIIMAWTIERMSILWEEEGGKEVLIQGSGSLIVAVIAYLLMSNEIIRHWAFNFLGIHLIIMVAILLMGQYSGYRLLELRRFNPLVRDE